MRRRPINPVSTAPAVDRDTAIAAAPRVKIDTPRLSGSISLKGARIDDLSLVQFRETVDPPSPAIVLYLALGHGQSLLCGIRLGRGQRLGGEDSRPEHGVAAGRLGQPDADQPGDAEI